MALSRVRTTTAIIAGTALGLLAWGDLPLRAATSSQPAVTLTPDTTLNQQVWPGDFNGDGNTDLIASDATTNGNSVLLVKLGNGTGTFGSPIKSTFSGSVVGVGDFNGDRKLDVIAVNGQRTQVYIVAGNGDGTLGAAHLVADLSTVGRAVFAVSGDLDGDGNRDLVVGIDGDPTVEVFPGNGDFTFETPVSLTTGPLPGDGIIADLNGDGRKDLVVTTRYFPHSVAVFLNQGAFTFTAADITLDKSATDVTAGDVNGDGNLDLLVSTADPEDAGYFTGGWVNVFLGNGDGTFKTPTVYSVPPGPWQIVVGDFTRDGILDIATANRSPIYYDDSCTLSFKTWDTVSILPGRGDGTFDMPWSFSLGDQSDLFDDRYRESVLSLNTSDLNGDHQTDLIASWGAILLNTTATNRAPSVSAGPNQSFNGPTSEVPLQATAADPDNDMLTYSWTASDGRSMPSVPLLCVQLAAPGTYTFTVTVNDGHGHTASSSVTYTVREHVYPTVSLTAPKAGEVVAAGQPYTIRFTASSDTPISRIDVFVSIPNAGQTICSNLPGTATSCTWNNPGPVTDAAQIDVIAYDQDGDEGDALSGQFSIHDSGGGTLPAGWQSTDVGAVGAAGSASSSSGLFTVNGSGADIWGTADAFQYVYRQMDQTFEMQARIDTVQNVSAWTKAGIMVRTSLDAGAPQASVFATPGHGLVFQRRRSQGATSISTQGPAITAPVWVRLAGFNGRVWSYYRKNITDPWTELADDVLSGYSSSTPFVGLAVTSHSAGNLATATFEQVTYGGLPNWNGGTSAIGVSASNASASYDGTLYALFSKSADVWGTSDAVTFLNAAWTGDGTITARVTSVDNTSAWAKAGVMIRETDTPGSKHVFLMVTPGKGVNLQYRATTSGQSASAASVAGAAPGWLRLRRVGNTFTAAWSTDGTTFATVGSVTVSMASGVTIGLALTSHNTSTTGGAHFDDVRIDP